MIASDRLRALLIWGVLALALVVPLYAATQSPLLAWRRPIYIAAGFAGIVAMGLLLLQPLLMGGQLPGFRGPQGRRVHRWVGGGLVALVMAHVVGLWITSPPDVIDVLLFRSPTPFSFWGAIAMWAVFAAASLAALRRRIMLRPQNWRRAHSLLVAAAVIGSVVHALQIEGTMETVSKWVLCGLVVGATLMTLSKRRVWGRPSSS
ncbi:ferric reductase-like transmembrane domain-containing protein [uncultured Shimia sp.]|uniref:ferric reductase-like transmembrane domain-containing protein n=1 Tax=uncultured Shimia sp. TaxID=573152 RepID=UPI002639D7C0|nr:ferric reductase-like transmembrane domain-containing protein [uncultured Shimia sp.]